MNYDEILKNDSLLLKAFGVVLIFGLSIAPGGMLILLEKAKLFVSLDISKLIFISFILSIPFNITGFLLYLSHPDTLKDLNSSDISPSNGKIWTIFLSSYVWGFLCVGFLYLLVKMQSLLGVPIGTKSAYLLNYSFMVCYLSFFIIKGLKSARNQEKH